MDKRAALPVTLPVSKPTVSYWQDPPDPELADYLTSEEVPGIADTVIIGSGITGSCIAWNLLEKNGQGGDRKGKIVMLEARQACSGATGRNGGHAKAASYRSFLSNKKNLGVEQAVKIAKLEYDNIKAVHAFSLKHNIDCDLFSGDTVDIIYDQAQWVQALEAVEAMRDAMPDELERVAKYTFYDEEEARERFWVKGESCMGAVSYQAGSLSAYKFVIGLLKMCVKARLELYTNTPATKLKKGDVGLWNVGTDRGLIKATKVVLATNGYTAFLCKSFRKIIVPLRGQITAHRPGHNMPAAGLPTTYSFISKTGYEYMIPSPPSSKHPGTLIIGGGLAHAPNEGIAEFGTTDDSALNPHISAYLTATTPRYFGSLASWGDDHPDGRVSAEWSGIMGYSPDGFPLVGEVPGESGLWVAAGFQGHGMVLCFLCAEALVEMMVGEGEGGDGDGDGDGEEGRLERWFPPAFRVTMKRLGERFRGRLHTEAEPTK